MRLQDSYLCPSCDNVSGGPGICIKCCSELIPLTKWIKPLANPVVRELDEAYSKASLKERLPSAYCKGCKRRLECIDGAPLGACPKGLRTHTRKGDR